MTFLSLGLAVGVGAALGAGAALAWASRRERLRARYLSFVAHEINTPVSALNMTILNFISGIFGPVPPEQMPWLVLIREQAARLNALVGDLRDLVHIEFHRDLRLNRESVDLEPLVSQCLEAMKEAMARSGAEMEVRLGKGLPAVDADSDRLGRVLTAILAHARKFRAAGSGPITLSTREEEGGVALTVEYQGPKAEAESASGAQALDLFYPVYHPESQVLASVGLGLGLPNRLVQAHGGMMTLDVDSAGRCRIMVRLPRRDPGRKERA